MGWHANSYLVIAEYEVAGVYVKWFTAGLHRVDPRMYHFTCVH